jgi:hypothetical protein
MARSKWSPKQIQLLEDHYPNKQASELVALIGRDESSIYHKAHKLCLKKSAEFLASSASGRICESPIGKEFVVKDGYTLRKINNDLPYANRWQYVHVIEWEKHHGPVPDGYMVTFKNGDKGDPHIDNLELITRKGNFDRNTINRYPPEVASLIRLQKKLEKTIKEGLKNA